MELYKAAFCTGKKKKKSQKASETVSAWGLFVCLCGCTLFMGNAAAFCAEAKQFASYQVKGILQRCSEMEIRQKGEMRGWIPIPLASFPCKDSILADCLVMVL